MGRTRNPLKLAAALATILALTLGTQACNSEPALKDGDVIYVVGWKPTNEVNDQALIEQKLQMSGTPWVMPKAYSYSRTAKGDFKVKAIYHGKAGNELTITDMGGVLVGVDHGTCLEQSSEVQVTLDPSLASKVTIDKSMWEGITPGVDTDDCLPEDEDTHGGTATKPGTKSKKPTTKPTAKQSAKPTRSASAAPRR